MPQVRIAYALGLNCVKSFPKIQVQSSQVRNIFEKQEKRRNIHLNTIHFLLYCETTPPLRENAILLG